MKGIWKSAGNVSPLIDLKRKTFHDKVNSFSLTKASMLSECFVWDFVAVYVQLSVPSIHLLIP